MFERLFQFQPPVLSITSHCTLPSSQRLLKHSAVSLFFSDSKSSAARPPPTPSPISFTLTQPHAYKTNASSPAVRHVCRRRPALCRVSSVCAGRRVGVGPASFSLSLSLSPVSISGSGRTPPHAVTTLLLPSSVCHCSPSSNYIAAASVSSPERWFDSKFGGSQHAVQQGYRLPWVIFGRNSLRSLEVILDQITLG